MSASGGFIFYWMDLSQNWINMILLDIWVKLSVPKELQFFFPDALRVGQFPESLVTYGASSRYCYS